VLPIPVLVRGIESENSANFSVKKTINRKPASRRPGAQYQCVLPLTELKTDFVRREIQRSFGKASEEKVELAGDAAGDAAEPANIESGLKDSELQSLSPDQIDHVVDALLSNEDEEEKQLEREWSKTLDSIRIRCREASDFYTTLNRNIKVEGAVQDKNRRKMLELSELVSELKPSSAMNFSSYESDPETVINATVGGQSALRSRLIQEETERYPRFASYKIPSASLPVSTSLAENIDSKLKKFPHTSSQLCQVSENAPSKDTNWPQDAKTKAVDLKLERNTDFRPDSAAGIESDPAIETDCPDGTTIKGSSSPPSSLNSYPDLTLDKTRHVSFQVPPSSEPVPRAVTDSTDSTTIRASSPTPITSSPSSCSSPAMPTHDSNGVPLISPYASDPRFDVDYDYGPGTDQHFVNFYPLTEYEASMTTEFDEFTQSVPILTNLFFLEDLVPVEEVVE
jgi:hypothetical protein